MARVTHAAQINLRFRHSTCEVLDFGVGPKTGNFARERFHLFRQAWNKTNGHAQAMAKSVARCMTATLRGFRAGAGPSVSSVGPDLTFAAHAALFPLPGFSITLNPASQPL